jgi:ribosomal small subunit protein bTHX
MGKGDKRSKKGKRWHKSYGKTRPKPEKSNNKSKEPKKNA